GKERRAQMPVVRAKYLRVLIALCLSTEVQASTITKKESDTGKLVSERYPVVREIVFPERLRFDAFPPDVRWLVVVTVSPPYSGSETWFSLTRKYNGDVELVIKRPRGGSLTRQLVGLMKKVPDATADK